MYIPDNAKWCENCDNPFIPDDKTDRFCSEICREKEIYILAELLMQSKNLEASATILRDFAEKCYQEGAIDAQNDAAEEINFREEFNRSYAYKELVTDLNIKNTIKHIQLEKEKL